MPDSSRYPYLSVKPDKCVGMVKSGTWEITPLEAQPASVPRVDSSTGHPARML